MSNKSVGCAKPTGKVIGDTKPEEIKSNDNEKEETIMLVSAKVGSKAPDFEAPAYHLGKFIHIKLSDYFGKWIVLCFYPGDFTFV